MGVRAPSGRRFFYGVHMWIILAANAPIGERPLWSIVVAFLLVSNPHPAPGCEGSCHGCTQPQECSGG